MDAIQFLKRDHDRFRKLLAQLEDTSDAAVKTRTTLFRGLKAELIAHETIEEEILYPALQEHEKAEEIVAHSYEEHHVVDLILDELMALAVDDPSWAPKAHVLKENLEHHLKEEEEEMFPKAKQLLGDELADMGEEMEERKDEVLSSADTAPSAKANKPRG